MVGPQGCPTPQPAGELWLLPALQYEGLEGNRPSSLPVDMGPLTALRRLGVRMPNSAAGRGAGAVRGVAMGGLGLVG